MFFALSPQPRRGRSMVEAHRRRMRAQSAACRRLDSDRRSVCIRAADGCGRHRASRGSEARRRPCCACRPACNGDALYGASVKLTTRSMRRSRRAVFTSCAGRAVPLHTVPLHPRQGSTAAPHSLPAIDSKIKGDGAGRLESIGKSKRHRGVRFTITCGFLQKGSQIQGSQRHRTTEQPRQSEDCASRRAFRSFHCSARLSMIRARRQWQRRLPTISLILET